MLSSRVSVTRCLKLVLVCCSLVVSSKAQAFKSGTTNQRNQEAILRDYVTDLKRLTSLQDGQDEHQMQLQQQPDQLASANHESFVIDDAALLSQLLLASSSAPLPQGRRRLDDAQLVTLPTDGQPMGSLAGLNLAASLLVPNHRVAAQSGPAPTNRRRGSSPSASFSTSGNQYDKIVDRGSGAELNGNSIPHSALVAMMTNNNFNRMAMASAMRSQRAQLERANAMVSRQHQQQLRARMQPKQRQPNNLGRQESKVNRKRMRGGAGNGAGYRPVEKLNEFTSRSGGDNKDGDDNEEDDRDGDDEADGEGSSGAATTTSRRKSGDDFFNELDDDDEESADGDGSSSANKGQAATKRSQQQLKQAASRQHPNKRKQIRGRQGDADNKQEEDDEDIDSTTAHQLTSQPELPINGRQVPLFKAKVSKRRSNDQQQQQRQVQLAMQTKLGPLEVATYHTKQQQQQQQQLEPHSSSQPDDDLSAASHVRNSATDLQTAAGKHYGGHHYHQMVEVPKKKAYKMSFKRGNHKHEISKHEKLHKHKFHTKFMWHAKEKCKKKKKCKSVGKMTWDYKHAKKHHH